MPIEAVPTGWTSDNCPAPEGWRWYRLPHFYGMSDYEPGSLRMSTEQRRTRESWAEAIRTLDVWAQEHDVFIQHSDNPRPLDSDGTRVQTQFSAYVWRGRNDPPAGPDVVDFFERIEPCPACGLVPAPDAFACECGLELTCDNCHAHHSVNTTILREDGSRACYGCTLICTTYDPVSGRLCGRMAPPNFSACVDHAPTYTCPGCEEMFDANMTMTSVLAGVSYCRACGRLRCDNCGEEHGGATRSLTVQGHTHIVCVSCYEAAAEHNRLNVEVQPIEVEDLLLESTPARPVRVVSIEQEFTTSGPGAGNAVARALYQGQLSPWSEQMRYHAGNHDFPAHVEFDRSVDPGGELIYNRLSLDNAEDADAMHRIVNIVNQEAEAGRIEFNVRCGTHIHIDLHGFTIEDSRGYVTLYNYLEDPIFRFASAGYADHRAIIAGTEYANPIMKGSWTNARQFGVEFLRNASHRDSLNMEHFYNAFRQGCSCGAIEFGNMEECVCSRPKCTAEWRVFNGTRDPRALMAYVSFVQSLTAFCQGRTIDPSDFEPLGFERGISFVNSDKIGPKHENMIEAWRPRLHWIFRNLQFQPQEKSNILAVMQTTPLRYTGEDFFDELAEVQAVEDRRTLTVPTFACRTAARRGNNVPPPWSHPGFDDEGYCLGCDETDEYCNCSPPEAVAEVPFDPTPDWTTTSDNTSYVQVNVSGLRERLNTRHMEQRQVDINLNTEPEE